MPATPVFKKTAQSSWFNGSSKHSREGVPFTEEDERQMFIDMFQGFSKEGRAMAMDVLLNHEFNDDEEEEEEEGRTRMMAWQWHLLLRKRRRLLMTRASSTSRKRVRTAPLLLLSKAAEHLPRAGKCHHSTTSRLFLPESSCATWSSFIPVTAARSATMAKRLGIRYSTTTSSPSLPHPERIVSKASANTKPIVDFSNKHNLKPFDHPWNLENPQPKVLHIIVGFGGFATIEHQLQRCADKWQKRPGNFWFLYMHYTDRHQWSDYFKLDDIPDHTKTDPHLVALRSTLAAISEGRLAVSEAYEEMMMGEKFQKYSKQAEHRGRNRLLVTAGSPDSGELDTGELDTDELDAAALETPAVTSMACPVKGCGHVARRASDRTSHAATHLPKPPKQLKHPKQEAMLPGVVNLISLFDIKLHMSKRDDVGGVTAQSNDNDDLSVDEAQRP
ncbi:hypothetical protein KVT40_007306 [Elsinoe batatas]|uniref:Uncharacterized protein n=1 Tax=Elsinoe batatas TaxID=2601811 RepID=A0A8K0PG54_9PEZI|nr:hypothetical protein KVT40_007306 [Elsinoe batatas]